MNTSTSVNANVSQMEIDFVNIWSQYRDITIEINWQEAGNGTGYFDPLQRMVRMEEGQVVRFTANEPDCRRGLIIGHGMNKSSSIVFERFSPNTGSRFVLVNNVNNTVNQFYCGDYASSINIDKVEKLLKFRMEMTTDIKILDALADQYIAECNNAKCGGEVPSINIVFWAHRFHKSREKEIETAMNNGNERFRKFS